jgi:hypothetical protein
MPMSDVRHRTEGAREVIWNVGGNDNYAFPHPTEDSQPMIRQKLCRELEP